MQSTTCRSIGMVCQDLGSIWDSWWQEICILRYDPIYGWSFCGSKAWSLNIDYHWVQYSTVQYSTVQYSCSFSRSWYLSIEMVTWSLNSRLCRLYKLSSVLVYRKVYTRGFYFLYGAQYLWIIYNIQTLLSMQAYFPLNNCYFLFEWRVTLNILKG